MSTVGLVSVPGEIVEPLIALSITYVALENLFTQSLSRWRMAVVFLFGLLHGMGFAGALAENGLVHNISSPLSSPSILVSKLAKSL